MQKINESRCKPAEQTRTQWQVRAEADMTHEDLLNPAVWANVARHFQPFDRIEVVAADGNWFAEYLVWDADRLWAKVELIQKRDRPAAGEDGQKEEYVVKNRGARKWTVMRKADNAVMRDGFQTSAEAEKHLAELAQSLAAEAVTTTRLKLYNGALTTFLGERALASLSENREPRRVLDQIWDDGLIDYCLGQGQWNHAMRSISLTCSPSVEPPFGYTYAFDKPSDWIRTAAVCSDEGFNSPLTQYADEAGYWFAYLDTLYIKYVSNDNAYGSDLSLWPETFTQFVECHMAFKGCVRITGNKGLRDELEKEARKLLVDARSKDALNEAAKFLPAGGWVRSRQGGSARERAGSQLIG